jgi:DNA polymerase-1
MSATKGKLFLLDAMALIYRAYYALNKNPRITSKGLNTSAILGFANTLYEIIKNEKPDLMGVAFDTHAPTQRHVDYVEYKSKREAVPEDILKSIPYIVKLIEAFNIPILSLDGYEADDIIGTLATRAGKEGYQVFMMTPDKDFAQLVTENVFIYKPGKPGEKATVMGVPEVVSRYCIKRPEQVKDLLGLWGDSSDNIPGIPGVGEITAQKLIGQYDSVENLVENAMNIDNVKMRTKVMEFGKQALLSKQLATILLDVPVEFNVEELKLKSPDFNKLKPLLEELEFKTFGERVLRDFEKSMKQGPVLTNQQPEMPDLFSQVAGGEVSLEGLASIINTPHNYHLVDTPEKRQELIKILESATNISLDTETTGRDPNNVELVGLSFCIKPGEAWYVPVPAVYGEAVDLVKEFAHIYSDERIEKTGHNLKYDIAVLSWYEVTIKGRMFDTMIAHYLIEPELRHNMDYLACTYLRYQPVSIETLIGKKGKTQLSLRDVPPSVILDYACEDTDLTLQLRNLFEPKLEKDGLRELFWDIEMPLVQVLASMESEGVKVDIDVLKEYSDELATDIAKIEQNIYLLAGEKFNIGSPKQLGEILFDKMRISDNPKRTKTKQHSTGEEILLKLAGKHSIIQQILDYRSLTKLKSTYIDSLPLLVNRRTGRIHTTYNQAVAATGRLSSNNPNLQNIPIRSERGREIRKAFVPRNQKFTLISADYSQIELRIIAEISGDEAMKDAFRQGIDIHTATASRIYNVDLKDVTRDMRRNAKTVNFGIIYGISAFGLSERLNIPRKEAAEIISQYFNRFSGIRNYMDEAIRKARTNGYVETIMKRRRYLRDINSANAVVRSFAERNAINAPIQGSSADMIKIAMINIYKEFTKLGLQSRMIMQVHDELVFDVFEDEVEIVKPIIREKMMNAMKLSIPIEVELSTGANWLEAH